MEVLDQQVMAALAVTEQCLNLGERCRIDLPAFRVIGPASAPRARMDAAVVFCRKSHNDTSGVIVIASEAKQSRWARSKSARDCFVAWRLLAMTIHAQTAPSLCIAAISSVPYPSQSSTSSVCSPSNGERFTSTGESERLIGDPTWT
jgi:hypothetical protein